MSEMDRLRKSINALDARIVDLLSRRARTAQKIAREKQKTGGRFWIPEREAEVYRRVKALNKGPLPDSGLRAIYREIMGASLRLGKRVRIAYLGPEATFSHQAAVRHFGHSAEYVPARTIDGIFDAVEHGRVDFGLVPVENSIEGVVSRTLDRFGDTTCRIISETAMPISENLIGRMRSARDVKKVCSHPQPLAQCARWLELNLPGVGVIEASSTADAARRARREKGVAAIASALAAEVYGLRVLAEGIEDFEFNMTRFLVIA